MKFTISAGAGLLALAASMLAAMPAPAWAGAADYEFQLVESTIKEGDGAVVAVRLLDKRTAQSVQNAVIFATRMDMAPDGMEAMTDARRGAAVRRARHLSLQDQSHHGRRLALFGRGKGPGRDRDGRRQAESQGRPMK